MLQHEHEVGLEVGEAELVEGDQRGLHALVMLLSFVVVELLGRLGVDADSALHQGAGLSEGLNFLGRFSNGLDWLIIQVLVISIGGSFDWILSDHLDVRDGDGFVRVGLNEDRLDAEDVTADLVAELDLASLHSEERGVTTLLLRCLELHLDLVGGTWDNLAVNSDNLGLHVISRGLKELGTDGPGGLSVIAHPPGLAECVSASDLKLVREALLDETSGVANVLQLLCCLALPSVSFLSLGSCLDLLHAHHLAFELADKLFGSVSWLADLEKRMLCVDSTLLAVLAEVSV